MHRKQVATSGFDFGATLCSDCHSYARPDAFRLGDGSPWAAREAGKGRRTGPEQMILILGLVRPLLFAVYANLAVGQKRHKDQ